MYFSPRREFFWWLDHCTPLTPLRSRAAIQGWLHKYSNNHHKGFSDYNKAVQYFNEHLASGKVVDKKGVVSAMTDDGPVYVPGLPGLSYAKVTAVPPASSLAAPY